MRRPAATRLASAIVVSVDLPIPGAPPISTSEPGTIPPPSTLSSSPIPVLRRSCSAAATSPSATGATRRRRVPAPRAARGAAPPAGRRTSSTSVFHSPQPGHCPAQRAVSWPQAEQTWTEVGRGTRPRLRAGADGISSCRARATAMQGSQRGHVTGSDGVGGHVPRSARAVVGRSSGRTDEVAQLLEAVTLAAMRGTFSPIVGCPIAAVSFARAGR